MRIFEAERPDSARQPGAAREIRRKSGQHKVPIDELLTSSFVRRHSRFEDLDALLSASGLDPSLLIDLDADAKARWDDFTRLATTFPDWGSLLRSAGAEWVLRRIGIVIDT